MQFNLVELKSIPKFKFALSVENENYYNRFQNERNFLETSFCLQGEVIRKYKDKTELIPSQTASCIFSCDDFESFAHENQKQCHVTVGVDVLYDVVRYDSDKPFPLDVIKEKVKNGALLLPNYIDLGNYKQDFLLLLEKIINHSHSIAENSYLLAISEWFSLCALLTKITMRKIDYHYSILPPSELNYARKATDYIHKHYRKSISVYEIALNIGLSEGYLQRIFKHVYGFSVCDYINRHRINVAIELKNNRNLSLKDCALNVGINDAAYMSRLFKKITGQSFRAYFDK